MISNANEIYWQEIKAIYIKGIETNMATFELVENIKDYSNWLSSKIEKSCFIYKTDNNKVIGWSSLSPISSRNAYSGVAEVSIYVDSDHSSCGVGSKLLEGLINFAENNNIWMLQAGIFPENESSIALHAKFGFRKVGYREKISQLHGQWRDNLLLERRSTTLV